MVEVINSGSGPAVTTATFTVVDLATGDTVAHAAAHVLDQAVIPGDSVIFRPKAGSLVVKDAKRWGPRSPNVYGLSVVISVQGVAVVDTVNTTFGFRNGTFTPDSGFLLDDTRVVLRGFSDHNSMAGVGVAVPPRLNLYRAQMLRAVGGNIWRMSHNPGDPAVFDILDRLGVMSWDENRDYGWYNVDDMRQMVRRDRNHPSIVVWSLCNAIECTEQSRSAPQP